ncbi:uncharacterized protein EMH_0039570 [Eimeria mitis]|uniref:Uncharacterized protein n=1 Tax=Eimeria mitis TaxID=44415 RepID=U6K1T3_9EIME|nr:uncharacterized protein EMH_0039570 [Eimeria mitis]CDJ31654.1 hypothetical protein, conserved [Eimeria mitis]
MDVTTNRRSRRWRERSPLEEEKTEWEILAESAEMDLAEFYYPFESNVDFVDTPTDETVESSVTSESEGKEGHSVPPTPPPTPMNEPERPDGCSDTQGPERDRRPVAVSRRAWHKLRRVMELEEKAAEEAEESQLRDEVTGRRDQSREAEEAGLCGQLFEDDDQVSPPAEGATTTLQSSISPSEQGPPDANPSEDTQQEQDANDQLENEQDEESPASPSTDEGAGSCQNEQCQEPQKETSHEVATTRKSAVRWPGGELPKAKKDSPEAPTARKSVVSWHPVAEVVTVEAGSPSTQQPVTRSTTDLVEKSTLRACRRLTTPANLQLGSSPSSPTTPDNGC